VGLNIMDINVFYSTFTNVFYFCRFFTFFLRFLFFYHVFYIYGVNGDFQNAVACKGSYKRLTSVLSKMVQVIFAVLVVSF